VASSATTNAGLGSLGDMTNLGVQRFVGREPATKLRAARPPDVEATRPAVRSSIRARRADLAQSHRVGNIIKLLVADFFELFPALDQFLVDLDRLLRHLFVRFLRPAHERKVPTGRDPPVAIGVQSDTQEHRFRSHRLLPIAVRHCPKLARTPASARAK